MNDAVLALDFGARLGWALRSRAGIISSGTLILPTGAKHGYGARFLHFRRWLVEQNQAGVDRVFFEEVRRHVSTDSAHSYGGFLAMLTAWCEAQSIRYQGVGVGVWKAWVVGNGAADKGQVIQAMKACGFAPADDNEADALALLAYVTRAPGSKPAPRIKANRKAARPAPRDLLATEEGTF
jgi:hypothetical protein